MNTDTPASIVRLPDLRARFERARSGDDTEPAGRGTAIIATTADLPGTPREDGDLDRDD
jgi:hypothetical protein